MIAGVFDEVFGLPTHPLAVHAPVVLVPIVAVASIVMAVRTSTRQRFWWAMPVVVLACAVLLFVAKQSGESLLDSEDVFLLGSQEQISEHESLGEATFVISLVWFVVTLALALRDRMTQMSARSLSAGAAPAERDVVATMFSLVVVAAAVVTTIWLIRTGHAGSESRWGT